MGSSYFIIPCTGMAQIQGLVSAIDIVAPRNLRQSVPVHGILCFLADMATWYVAALPIPLSVISQVI